MFEWLSFGQSGGCSRIRFEGLKAENLLTGRRDLETGQDRSMDQLDVERTDGKEIDSCLFTCSTRLKTPSTGIESGADWFRRVRDILNSQDWLSDIRVGWLDEVYRGRVV